MTFAYTQNTPNANDTIAKTQPIIKANFNYLRTWGLFDHRFSSSTSDVLTGAHNKITFPANMAAPGIGTAASVLYPSNGTGYAGIAIQNSSGSFDITGRNPDVPVSLTADIETCLPGKILLKAGVVTTVLASTTANNNVQVTFSRPFLTDCRNVTITPIKTGGNISSSLRITITVQDLQTTGFKYSYTNQGGSTSINGFYWVAIGT